MSGMKSRLLSVTLAFVLAFSGVPVAAFAEAESSFSDEPMDEEAP